MSAGRKGSPEVTAQANIIAHSPRSESSCRWEREDSPPACCEAPSWCAIAVSAGPWIIDPLVAQRIAAKWDQDRARKARRAQRRCMGQDACGAWVGTSIAPGSGSSVWLAGGGITSGMIRGVPDDVGYEVVESPATQTNRGLLASLHGLPLGKFSKRMERHARGIRAATQGAVTTVVGRRWPFG